MRIIECPQYSPEYWEAKRGIPSASNFHRILTAKTMRPAAAADEYINELVADAICQCPPFFTERPGHTAAQRNGLDCEPDARRWYEMHRDCDVRQVGLCITDDGSLCCSPDGLVGDDGLLELKCPELKTQIGYLRTGELPPEYRAQCAGQLIVTERRFVDFVSYHPDTEPLIVRVEPDAYMEALRVALQGFVERYQATLRYFRREPLSQTLEAAIAETRSRA